MKYLIFALLSFSMFQAHSEELYKCKVTAIAKAANAAPSSPWTKYIYLSQHRSSSVDFYVDYATALTLNVAKDNSIEGTVNGQRNFILKGNYKAATFESAYATGTITCQAPKNYDVAFYFKSWNTIFVQGDKDTISQLHGLGDMDTVCYIGSQARAAEIFAEVSKVDVKSLEIQPGSISATTMVKPCLESEGSYDSYTCLKYGPAEPAKVTSYDCDYNPYPQR